MKDRKMIETAGGIEPCLFEEFIPAELADLAVEVHRAAADLGRGLHPESAQELADLVRIMNCYYSNLIEGHNTRPRDIERALVGAELSEETRPLALEARAHDIVQRQIDERFLNGAFGSPTSSPLISWVHEAFYREMPPEFRFVVHLDGTREEMIPGKFRAEGDADVAVGRHLPPSSHRVDAFMDHFSKRFRSTETSASGQIIAIEAAHHRLKLHPPLSGREWPLLRTLQADQGRRHGARAKSPLCSARPTATHACGAEQCGWTS